MQTGTEGQGITFMDMSFDPGADPPQGPFVAVGDGDGFLSAQEAIDVAGTIFREVAEELHKLRAGIRSGNTDDAEKTGKLVRDLRVAASLVLEERNRVDKLRKDIAGGVGAGQLDLDAARDEIGRRLACLRRARGD